MESPDLWCQRAQRREKCSFTASTLQCGLWLLGPTSAFGVAPPPRNPSSSLSKTLSLHLPIMLPTSCLLPSQALSLALRTPTISPQTTFQPELSPLLSVASLEWRLTDTCAVWHFGCKHQGLPSCCPQLSGTHGWGIQRSGCHLTRHRALPHM